MAEGIGEIDRGLAAAPPPLERLRADEPLGSSDRTLSCQWAVVSVGIGLGVGEVAEADEGAGEVQEGADGSGVPVVTHGELT